MSTKEALDRVRDALLADEMELSDAIVMVWGVSTVLACERGAWDQVEKHLLLALREAMIAEHDLGQIKPKEDAS